MAKKNKSQIYNSARRLPIVFCLDVSPSMGWRIGNNSASIELLNEAVNQFIEELRADIRACSSAEIAFVTFTDRIEVETDFESVRTLPRQTFKTVEKTGTSLAQAVLHCIKKIENHREKLSDMETSCFAPFFVLVTDGDPDINDPEEPLLEGQALNALLRHCGNGVPASEFIVPFVIGVGDHVNPERLDRYASGVGPGHFSIKGQTADAQIKFGKVFKLIRNSASQSVRDPKSEMIQMIQSNMADLYADLIGE